MKYIVSCIILTLTLLNPFMGFTSDQISPDFSPYIEKYFQLLAKGNRNEKKLSLSNLPHLLSDEKYRKKIEFFDPFVKALKDNDPTIREAAAASLKIFGKNIKDCHKSARIVPSLIEALKDRQIAVRREAAKALGFYDDSRAVDPLINILQKDKNPWVRLEAAYSLGQLNAKKAVPALINSSKDTNQDWRNKIFQQECLIAFRKIGYRDTQAIRLLIKNINDQYLKAEIIKSLGQFRSMAAKNVLFKATQDKTAIIRKLSIQAIERLPLVRTRGMSGDQHPKTDLFIKFLIDPSPDVRATSAESLGKTGDRRSVGPLSDALKDSDWGVQKQAILSLGRYKDKKILSALVPFLGSSLNYLASKSFLSVAKKTAEGTVFVSRKEFIRYAVKTRVEIPVVLEEVKPSYYPFTLEGLIHKYPTPDEKRKQDEPKFLRKISTPLPYLRHIIYPDAVTTLIHAMKNTDKQGKIGVLEVIKKFEDDRIEPILIELLKDQSPQVRIQTLSTLSHFATLNSLPAIVDSLNDQDDAVRRKAARILGLLKNKCTIQRLLQRLDDNEETVRAEALSSLRNFDDPQISDANIRMLDDKSPEVREVALRNIIRKPDKRVVESVIPLLADSKTSALAAEVLGLIGDKRAIDPLITALNDGYRQKGELPNRQLMITAAKVLSSFEESRITPLLVKKVGADIVFKDGPKPPFLGPRFQIYGGSTQKFPFLLPAMRIFQRYGDHKTLNILNGYLSDTDKDLRKGAMFLFGMYQEEKAVKQLEQSLNDPDPGIKAFAKEIIQGIRSKSLRKIKESLINQPGKLYSSTVTAINPYMVSMPLPIRKHKAGQKIKGLSPHFFSQATGEPLFKSFYNKRSAPGHEQEIQKYLELLRHGSQKQKIAALRKISEFLGITEYKNVPSCMDTILNVLIDKDPALRQAAAGALNNAAKKIRDVIKGSDIVPSLTMALYDEVPGVRRNAAKALGRFRDKHAASSLIERVYDEDPLVRLAAASSLGELETKSAIPALLDLFKDNTSWGNKSLVRNACLIAMRNIGYRPIDSLPMLVEHFNDKILKAEIVKALARSYPPDAKETKDLLLKAANDPDGNVRRAAIEAIAKLSRLSAIRARKKDSHDIEFYIKFLKDPSAPVRAATIEVLSKTKDTRAVEPIIQALHDRDEKVQREAIIALGKFQDERALDDLVVFLGSPSTKLHQLAVASFFNIARKTREKKIYAYIKNGVRYVADRRSDVPKGIGKTERLVHQHAVDTLFNALSHDSTDVKIGVLHEIWRFDDDRIEPMLLKLLDDPSTKVRRLSLNQLHNFKTERSVSRLVEALSDKDVQMRAKAAGLLGLLKSKQAVNPLLDSLNDSQVDVKRSAIFALGYIQDKSAIDPLIKRLSDPDDKIRKAALHALSMFDGLTMSNINLKMLKDDSLEVRCAAIRNIKKKPDDRAVDTLIRLLEDADTSIEAADALGVIGDPRAVDPLIDVLNGRYSKNLAARTDKAFKLSAAKALGKLKLEIAVRPLINIINNSDRKLYLRIAAVQALGDIGNKKATESLIKILTDNHSDMWLRATSASALGNIGDKKAVGSLTKATNEVKAPIRNAAEDALRKIAESHRAVRPSFFHTDVDED
jgi:HEAT repeat protein